MVIDAIVCGHCLDVLPTIPAASIDAVITDPPYPCIKRDYGYWTEQGWWALIVEGVIPEVRRILKPTGSAVFILQPNSRKMGSMRGWLWEFMAWVCREWNMVQDAYWWNYNCLPVGGAITHDLLRGAIKFLVWMGPTDCYRNQGSVLWTESQRMVGERRSKRFLRGDVLTSASGRSVHRQKTPMAALHRGGVTPHNLIPLCNNDPSHNGAGAYGHGAGTPLKLADWWTRYIVPPGGVVVDPFIGSGTMAVAAIQNGCHYFGCDTMQDYVDIANERAEKAKAEGHQMEMAL